jgi:Tfp pilus assembly protein PilV
MKKFRFRFRSPHRGFALVVALIAIVLVTILILAFFARAVLNRQVSFSSTNQIKADMLARSALDLITGELRQEIVDFSDVTNGIHMPKAATNMLPIPTGVANADTTTGQYTIAKVAGENVAVNPGAGGRLRGSAVSLSAASRNGRTQSRWFDSGPKLGMADLPTWVYLTRNGAASNSLTAADGRNPASTNFVTGRFSFTVYNTGGLLNANVAGYSATLVAATNASLRSKSSLAYADLTALGIGQEKINAFVAWRNARTGTNAAAFEQWASGIAGTNTPDREALRAAASGYTETVIGDNAFVSRRDLVRYLETHGFPTNAAASFSHTSRALDAPSWGPSNVSGANSEYGDEANDDDSINRFIPGVKAYNGTMRLYADDGTFEEVEVTENEPLVQTRFSLAKLAWLGHNGPNSAAFNSSLTPAQRERAIRDCFGLTWHNSSGGTSSDARWNYNHGNANDIMILSEVRDEERAPDFFELLKAGILEGSVGGEPGVVATDVASNNAADTTGPAGRDFDAYSADQDRHILQLGANIIDQADADNYPTAIHMNLINKFNGSEREFYNTVFGLENLPMLQRMGMINSMMGEHRLNSAPPATPYPSGPMGVWLQPEVWSPNERSSAGSSPADSKHPTPSALRLVTYGRVYLWNVTEDPSQNETSTPIDFGTDFLNPSLEGTVGFKNPAPNSTMPQNFFSNPVRLRGFEKATGGTAIYKYDDATSPSGPNNRYPSGINWVSQSLNNNQFLGVFFGQVERDPQNFPQYEIRALIDGNLTFVLEYFDGATWRPYNALSRIKTLHENGGGSGSRQGSSAWLSAVGPTDPRTQRFSGSAGRVAAGNNIRWNPDESARPVRTSTVSTGNTPGRNPIMAAWPRSSSGFTHTPVSGLYYLFDDWAMNLDTAAAGNPVSAFRYEDPDAITRPGDSSRADYDTGDGVMLYQEAELPSTSQRRRPIILNRPFRSVGELSYVFRDQPFKTLDFWSEKSADAGLLDLFAVSASATGVTAAQINPNAATPAVLTALLSGAGKQAATDATLDADAVSRVAEAVTSAGTQANRSALGDRLGTTIHTALTNAPANGEFRNKTYGEAPVRTLASVTTTRAWNFLIDVVAQSGRLAANAGGLQDFLVEGERRYWLHVAIDRHTGEILDQQLEPVLE